MYSKFNTIDLCTNLLLIKSTIDFRGNQINNRFGIRIFPNMKRMLSSHKFRQTIHNKKRTRIESVSYYIFFGRRTLVNSATISRDVTEIPTYFVRTTFFFFCFITTRSKPLALRRKL